MSTIIVKNPAQFQPTKSDGIFFTVSADTTTEPKFRFVYELYVEGYKVFDGKATPNPYGLGIIDVSRILDTYVANYPISYYDDQVIFTHQTGVFSRPYSNEVVDYYIKVGEEYADSFVGNLTGFTGIGDQVGFPGVPSSTYKAFLSTMGVNRNAQLQDFDIGLFTLSGSPSPNFPYTTDRLFLTNSPRIREVDPSEFYTLSFTNGPLGGSYTSEPYFVKYTFYDYDGVQITAHTYANIQSNGGGPAEYCYEDYVNYTFTGWSDYNILNVGAGPQNIWDLPGGTKYYTIQLFGKASVIPPSPTPTKTPTETPGFCKTYSVVGTALDAYYEGFDCSGNFVTGPVPFGSTGITECLQSGTLFLVEANVVSYTACTISPTPTPTQTSTIGIPITPTPTPSSPVCWDCADAAVSGSYSGTSYYSYPITNVCSSVNSTVTFNWTSYDRPNRFSIYDSSGLIYTTGWKGYAPYPGPWGSSLNTATNGSQNITFNSTTGRYVLVEAGNGSESDSYVWDMTCIDVTPTPTPSVTASPGSPASTPSPTPSSSTLPQGQNVYVRDCCTGQFNYQVEVSSTLSVGNIIVIGNNCYEIYALGGTGIDGNYVGDESFIICNECVANYPCTSTPQNPRVVKPNEQPTRFTPSGGTAPCVSYTPVSEIFQFNIIDKCNPFGNLQIMFKNRYGAWDYFFFTRGKAEGIGIERETYGQYNTTWGSSNPMKTNYSRGITDFNINMKETHILNSGFLNDPEFVWLEELYTSNDVYLIDENANLIPINIVATEFVRKSKGNRSIVNLELTIAYSNNIKLLNS